MRCNATGEYAQFNPNAPFGDPQITRHWLRCQRPDGHDPYTTPHETTTPDGGTWQFPDRPEPLIRRGTASN